MKDFSQVKYLKFSAHDPWECNFIDVVIDLTTNQLVSGRLEIGDWEDPEGLLKIDISKDSDMKKLSEVKNIIFGKVVDTGSYYLLDENNNVLFQCDKWYVPSLLDYYNVDRGYGDCIYFKVNGIRSLVKSDQKNIWDFNQEDDWTENKINQDIDIIDSILSIINEGNLSNQSSAEILANIITVLNKIKSTRENNVQV